MSLTSCIKKAGSALNPDDKKAILARAGELRKEGLKATEAAVKAVDELIARLEGEMQPEAAPVRVAPTGGSDEGQEGRVPAEAAEAVEAQDAPMFHRAARVSEVGGYKVTERHDGGLTVAGDPDEIRSLMPDGVKGRQTDDGVVFAATHAPRVLAALQGEQVQYGRAGQVKDHPRYKGGERGGQYIGAPAKYNTPAKLPHLRRLFRELALEGEPGKLWYERSGAAILEMVGHDRGEARKFISLLAIYSPQAKVDANSTFALRAWVQYKAGEPISVKTGSQDRQASEVLYEGKQWGGEKTNNFFRNLMREVDEEFGRSDRQGVAVDMWMMRAAGYETDVPTRAAYRFVENETNRLARDLGWEPQQVQAAIWVAMKARLENAGVKQRTEQTSQRKGYMRYVERDGKKVRELLDEIRHRQVWLDEALKLQVSEHDTNGAKFDFADGVRRHMGQVSWEARPGRSTGVLPGVNDAPYEQQAEFQQAVAQALTGPNGEDLLAQKVGLLADGRALAPGVWQSEVAAGMQSFMASAPAKGGELAADAAQRKLLNVYADTLGLLLRQEGVGWHKPFYAANKRDQNGLELDVGRPLEPAEMQALWHAVDREMKAAGLPNWEESAGLISAANGVRLVSFGGMDNAAFRALVQRAAEALPDSVTIEMRGFATDGDLRMNDWKESPNGEGYRQRIRAAGRPDVLQWAASVLAPRVQAVFEDFGQRYGWGDPGRLDLAAEAQARAAEEEEVAGLPAFSRASRGRAKGVSVTDLRALVRGLRTAYPVHAASSIAEWPAGLRAAVEAAPHNEGIDAVFHDGEIWLAAERIPDIDEAQKRILHESLHGGFQGLFGKDRQPMMMRLYRQNESLRTRVDAMRKRLLGLSVVEAAEETLVDMGVEGEAKRLKGWAAFVAQIKDWLRRNGFLTHFVENFNDNDVLLLLKRAGEIAQGERKPAMRSGYSPDAMFHRPDWVESGGPELQSAAAKVDTFAPAQPLKDKLQGLTANWKDKLVQGMIDAYAPLKKLSLDAYIAARMVRSADGAFEGMLLYGKPKMNPDGGLAGELDGKGFLGVMQELQGEHDRFFMWIAGNRSRRLKAEGRENLFTDAEIDAMLKLNAGQMKDGSSREAAYRKAAQEFAAYNRAVLDIAEKSGLIDGESRSLWEHDFYVPYYRLRSDDTLAGPTKVKGLVRQQAFKKLKGGKEPLGDLMDNTMRNWAHLLSASLANQAAGKALVAAESAGVAIEAKEDDAKEMAKSIGKAGGAVYFMDGGQQRWYVVDDPLVLEAISAMESPGLSGLPLKLMGKFKHWLTLGVTISPAFKIRNLIRDSLAAPAANEMSFNVLKNLTQGWKGTARDSDTHAKMLFGGGLMRFGTYLEGDRAEHVKRLINAGVKDSTVLDTPEKVKAVAGKFWDAWQEFGDRLENVNRAALYKQLLEQGMSERDAAFHARDMMDFSLQGSWAAMRILTATVPFLNARIQGLYKLGRGVAENPKRFSYVVGAVALASIALMLAYDDDEDWKAREDWDRDAFWWFKIGDTAYRIPKPFEVGALGTIAERSVELMVSDEMTGKRFAQRLRHMLLDTFSMNPIPQMFKPMIDIYANKDSFTGRPIETQGMERHSKGERYDVNTTIVARALGSAGDVTGLSPVQIDHMIRAYFGWLGAFTVSTADVMARPFGDVAKPAMRIEDFSGGFVKALPANQSRYLTDFYEQAREVSQVMADIKRARESGDFERARELAEDNADKVAVARVYSKAERQMSKINAQIRKVKASATLDAKTKREEIDRLTAMRNQVAKTVRSRGQAQLPAAQ